MKANYIKSEEIKKVNEQQKKVQEAFEAAEARVEMYHGMSVDLIESARLKAERVRLSDLEMDLKDMGRVAA